MMRTSGFTIVELLIVVVVIAILASITIVSYNGIANQAKESVLKSELQSAAKQLLLVQATEGSLPADADGVKKADTTTLTYVRIDNNSFCLAATSTTLPDVTFHTMDGGAILNGGCSGGPVSDGSIMQEINDANCPDERTRAVDARDNHTYWVQRLDDGNCWMLTNLAYAGGGTNTYGDTKTLVNGTSGAPTYTTAQYYEPGWAANITSGTTNPSTSTTGIGQSGYLYNWCGAMGGQATAACANSTTPSVNTSVTICPAGWRLPIGGASGEYVGLNNAINGGSSSSDAGLRTTALIQYSGSWNGYGEYSSNSVGYYWQSTPHESDGGYAYVLHFLSFTVNPANNYAKSSGFAVRCIAS